VIGSKRMKELIRVVDSDLLLQYLSRLLDEMERECTRCPPTAIRFRSIMLNDLHISLYGIISCLLVERIANPGKLGILILRSTSCAIGEYFLAKYSSFIEPDKAVETQLELNTMFQILGCEKDVTSWDGIKEIVRRLANTFGSSRKGSVGVLKGEFCKDRKLVEETIGNVDKWLNEIRRKYRYIYPENVLRNLRRPEKSTFIIIFEDPPIRYIRNKLCHGERIIIHRQHLPEVLENRKIIEKHSLNRIQEYLNHHWKRVSEPALSITRKLVSRMINS
jgi:hypothetical protein